MFPVIKDKNRRVNDKGNYRSICLSNIGSKTVEAVFLNRMGVYLQTTPHQFGFKSKHGTELCVFAFKELLRFYTKHGSAMYVAFLDAAKAFDRVNRQKLITKLTQLDVPKYLLRVICNEYNNQSVYVRWGSTYSEFFPVGNGVKQGGKLSPLLLNVYMVNLSVQLYTKPVGCSLGTTVVNHLIYADDLLLFAPSGKGQQTLLDSRNANFAREITLGRTKLNFATSCKYLGHVICNDLSDEADIQAKVRLIYAKSNMLRQHFHYCSSAVKNKLFTAYFSNVYMCALWVNYRKAVFQHFIVAYNNSYSILNRLPMRCSASHMFAAANVNSCKCVTRNAIYSLMTRIEKSLNPIIQAIVICDTYGTSKLRIHWIASLYNL